MDPDLNQPPQTQAVSVSRPDWLRPVGVSEGTWDYVHQRTIADHYDSFVAETPLCQLDRRIIDEIFPVGDPQKNISILDLGCGTGRTALPLAERGYRVFGVDLSRPMLSKMLEKVGERRLQSNVFAIQANLVALDALKSNAFDHSVCLFSTLGMIQGRENRIKMLNQLSRIVSDGGIFLVHVHHRWSAITEPKGPSQLAKSMMKAIVNKEYEFGDSTYRYRGIEKMFMHRFSLHELKADLRRTHWQVESVHRVSIDGTTVLTNPFQIAGGFFVTARCLK